jgi:ketosteroid isomerase-like protein
MISFAAIPPLASAQTSATQKNTAVDVLMLLKRHDEAMNQHDLVGIMQLYARGANTVLLGTGPGERYQGLSEIRTAYTEILKDFDKGTLETNCYWKDGGSAGTVAWGAAMCKISDSLGGKKREYELNVSAVMEKQGSRWLFRLLHFSNLTGGPATN